MTPTIGTGQQHEVGVAGRAALDRPFSELRLLAPSPSAPIALELEWDV